MGLFKGRVQRGVCFINSKGKENKKQEIRNKKHTKNKTRLIGNNLLSELKN
jgi:hypothetical protein